jgi:glycosidase
LEETSFANRYDRAQAPVFDAREEDWRNGAVIYQVIVDRFAPSADLAAKRHLYPPPKRLLPWETPPTRGEFVEEVAVWSHEIDFWGGDLQSVTSRLGHIEDLGVDVLYLNPIHRAYTNHKYDALDYFDVSPEYGSREDIARLAEALHRRGMRLMLDGVFNHMGLRSPLFQDALRDPESPWRGWFFIGPEYEMGYRAWANVPNLPEVRLENPEVRARLYGDPDSVIQGYLREGVDGWRLDVAFDIGFVYLDQLTRAAHRAKSDSLVIGEVWNYPEEWMPAVDGLMNMTARQIILELMEGEVSAQQTGVLLERLIEDCGIEPLLKSWIILDNHDVPRLRTLLPEQWQQRMAQVLQFTLPGSPCIYYGVEVGMEGGDDPEQRGPMPWDLVTDDNPHLQWMRKLMNIRRSSRALRIGDFRLVDTERLLAFTRRTDRVRDTTVIVANPTDEEISEILVLRHSKIMSYSPMTDQISGDVFRTMAGTLSVTVPPHTVYVLQPDYPETDEYSNIKRVQ